MLSLEQIKSVTFDRVVRGYRPEDVDDFINQVAAQIQQLTEEKQSLENKMYILAETVEEYRGDEAALKAALINAQKLGESVISEANSKAEQIVKEAQATAERERKHASELVKTEQQRLTFMQQEVSKFRGSVIDAYKTHIELLSNLPVDVADEEVVDIEETEPVPMTIPQAEPLTQPLSMPYHQTAEVTRELPQLDDVPIDSDNFITPQPVMPIEPVQHVAPILPIEREEPITQPLSQYNYPPQPTQTASEVAPIIPVMDDEQLSRENLNEAQGRISLFNHYSDFELDEE